MVSKTEGINTTGLDVEYLRNSNQWWGNWLIPVSAGFRTTDLTDKALKKTTYQSASTGQLTIGLSGYNQLSKSVLLNVSGETDKPVFVGVHSFQGVMIIPQPKLPIVIKAELHEEVLNSNL